MMSYTLNEMTMAQAVVSLSGKLNALGVTDIDWHDSVESYQSEVEKSAKKHVGEYFRQSLNVLPPNRFFGLTGRDASGSVVCTTAIRYDNVDGWDLKNYIERFWARNYEGERGGPARMAQEALPFAQGITGPFGYIGDTTTDSSLAGNNVASYLVRLCVVLCYLKWRPAYIYGWMARAHAAKGLPFRWGFPEVWPDGAIWSEAPKKSVYGDLCFVGCPPIGVAGIVQRPLDIGSSGDQTSSKQ